MGDVLFFRCKKTCAVLSFYGVENVAVLRVTHVPIFWSPFHHRGKTVSSTLPLALAGVNIHPQYLGMSLICLSLSSNALVAFLAITLSRNVLIAMQRCCLLNDFKIVLSLTLFL